MMRASGKETATTRLRWWARAAARLRASARLRWLQLLTMAAGTFATAAVAQPGEQRSERADLEGVWVATLTHLEDPRWHAEDLLCGGCAREAWMFTQGLLADRHNDDRSLADLQREARKHNIEHISNLLTASAKEFQASYDQADDPVNQCIPSGFFQAAGPLPIEIRHDDGRIVFRYEFWNSVRTVHLDRRGHPPEVAPSRLGHSIGWYDGPTLVVETVGIEPSIYGAVSGVDGMRTSNQARAIERYTVSEDGGRLEIEETIVDPLLFRQPLTTVSGRLRAPEVELIDDQEQCEAPSGVR